MKQALFKVFKKCHWISEQLSSGSVSGKRYSEKFRNIHRKTPKVAGLEACNFIKKRLQHRCFATNIVKFFRTAFFIEHLRWQLLISVLLHDYVKAFLNYSFFGLYVWSFSCFRQKRRMRDLDRTGQINMRETKVGTTVSFYGLLTRFTVLVSFCAL